MILIKLMHGNFGQKLDILDKMFSMHPECTKKSIEKKIKESFVKDKRQGDPKGRWYASDSCLAELDLLDNSEIK